MKQNTREPIRNYKIWLGFLIIFILLNPWYFPSGEEPVLVFGVPLWALVILGVTVMLSLYITYVIRYHWDIEDEPSREEEK
ncbi:hypothetical protein J4760_06360 [Salinicoccus sp. ID82-1]|uniref:DUF3311 domain-containing protein n=1 Tax=Salinicoccus cyprini TaxID=2493691 RepID=A0A558AS32_9STAP|nr:MULTISPECIES: hypothetical protein [Salinicoccus]MCG1009640.1 hypothetical protein [Salinicoccus sp. ID82-1]TVT27073.1 hypothetical protein FO441_11275 [Salinicoccus cyprini]